MFGGGANTWTEADATWDTRSKVNPTAIDEVMITSVSKSDPLPDDYSKSYEVDIAAYLNEALAAGQTNISFAIKAKPKSDGGKWL
jgi:hypothetical protein